MKPTEPTRRTGWTEELESLDLETEKLLRACRGEKERAKKKPKPIQVSSSPFVRKQKSEKKLVKKAPPPPEPRSVWSSPIQRNDHVLEPADVLDRTEPLLEARLKNVREERARLKHLEKARVEHAVHRAHLDLEKKARSLYLEQDLAAVAIQKITRKKQAEDTLRILREEHELNQLIAARWVQVKDGPESWFYNTLTKESQWHDPHTENFQEDDALKNITLPLLPQQQPESPVQDMRISRFQRPGDALYSGEDELLQSCCETPKSVFSQDTNSILRPDGTLSKFRLKKAVEDTLKQHKFDNVRKLKESTFLHYANSKHKPRSQYDKKKGRQYMTAISVLDKDTHQPIIVPEKKPNLKKAPTSPINLAIRQVAHPGFCAPDQENARVCFVCWSAGKKSCGLQHDQDTPNESVLMCENWDLNIIAHKYRGEKKEKMTQSLRYDRQLRGFVTIQEYRHPIHRKILRLVREANFSSIRRWHVRACVLSIAEQIRIGKVPGLETESGGKLLRLRNSMRNRSVVRIVSRGVQHPIPPRTGASFLERFGNLRVLVDGRIQAGPIPFPVALYKPRVYQLPAPRTIPLPEPEYAIWNKPKSPLMPQTNAAAWLELQARSMTSDCTSMALTQIQALKPVAGMELLRRTKYPIPHTIRFATFRRKPTPGNKAIGGLAAEILVHQLVQTVVPPQFGNFTLSERSAIVAQTAIEEAAHHYNNFKCPPVKQRYIARPVEHALNTRIAPAITIMANLDSGRRELVKDIRNLKGLNRPHQTGEEGYVGFRTSARASGYALLVDSETHGIHFVPSNDVVSANLPVTNPTFTTSVDRAYPFCEPSTRPNSTLDYYHLLLRDQSTRNMAQVFSVLGIQDPGKFMHRNRSDLALGSFCAVVYRSWSFLQKLRFEQFYTDDGLPYYYDRRTGETYWERPLADCEKLPVTQGGVRIDEADDCRDSNVKVNQRPTHEIRKLILKHKETEDEVVSRRRTVNHFLSKAAADGTLPDIPASSRIEQPHQVVDISKKPTTPVPEKNAARRRSISAVKTQAVKVPQLPLSPGSGGARRKSYFAEPATGTQQESNFLTEETTVLTLEEPPQMEPEATVNPIKEPNAVAANLASSVAAALMPALAASQQFSDQPLDLLKLGLGLGMGLGAGMGAALGGMPPSSLGEASILKDTTAEARLPVDQVEAAQYAQLRASNLGAPIGVPEPSREAPEWQGLEHSDEIAQKENFAAPQPLSTTEQFQGIQVVDLSLPPDETVPKAQVDDPASRQEAIEQNVPVIAHPDRVRGYATHGVAGASKFSASISSKTSLLRRVAEPLPDGFFEAIHATHVARARCDYLPWIPNLPSTKTIGRIKPRPAALDWQAVGFDPWSAGKEPLTTEFVKCLSAKADSVLDLPPSKADDSFMEVVDKRGLAIQNAQAVKASRHADDFATITSLSRHGKYREIEDCLNQPDWDLPIDYQDHAGNTMLSIAVQNGNKRIAKLCLRRGANINLANSNGQTVLHYAYAYGFQSLAEYLKSKGADDSRLNVDGLTCYEGLTLNEIDQL